MPISQSHAATPSTISSSAAACGWRNLQSGGMLSSPVLRQVPLPPGVSALRWLRGQDAAARGVTSVYFSPRRSSAPTTPGIVAAGQAAVGIQAVAGRTLPLCVVTVPASNTLFSGCHVDSRDCCPCKAPSMG